MDSIKSLFRRKKTLREGQKIPTCTFKHRVRIDTEDENPFDWKNMKTEDYFKNKRCILFGVPGAFTPTCSNKQLPDFERMYDQLKKYNIDEIYCISVNDAFVMRKWGLDIGLEEDKTVGSLGFKKVKLIPDGAGIFTKLLNMDCIWNDERGFGIRSWRYCMIVDNMIIEKLFIEPNKKDNYKDDPYSVTKPENVYNYLRYRNLLTG